MLKKVAKNLILYFFSFIISIYLHKGTLTFSGEYDKYLSVFILSWAAASLLSRKFKTNGGIPLRSRLYTNTLSFFLMLGTLAICFYYFNLMGVSRAIILYSLMFAFIFEVSLLLYTHKESLKLKNINLTYSGMAFFFEVNLFEIISFYLCYFISGKSNSFDSKILFICLSLSWFTGSFLGHHFSLNKINSNYFIFIWRYIKSYIIILALSLFSAFITRLDSAMLKYIVFGVLIYSLISFTGASLYYYIKRYRRLVLNLAGIPIKGEFGDVLLNENIQDIRNNYRSTFNSNGTELLQEKLKNLALKRYPDVYEFVDKCLELNSFDNSYSLILKSDKIINIEFLPDGNLQLLINIQKVNQIHNINEYFVEVNKKLMDNGIFIGNFETVYLRHQWFLKNYPYYFAQLFYFLDFLWNRVFSKIILCRGIYKAIMGGINKALSLAEGLGRLYYCGFEVLHLKIINNNMYFIARKNEVPSNGSLPSTGLIFKMKRLGKDYKLIDVYKFRTMHPYAEYLQDFVYERFKLQEGGKFTNDFRITYWGKILRKFWIDELPMIFNFIKGDIKLVGPRPLSKQYFDLYSPKLKQKRMKIKPGLIPPFYIDMPKTLNEIMDSEEKYLNSYANKPITTDIKYFCLILFNILRRRARSS